MILNVFVIKPHKTESVLLDPKLSFLNFALKCSRSTIALELSTTDSLRKDRDVYSVGINFFHLPLLIPSTGGLAKVESLSYLKIISLMAFSQRVISEEAQKP